MNGRVEPNPIMPVGNGTHGRGDLAERAKSMADQRKEQLSERIAVVGQAFKKTAEELRNEQGQEVSRYVEALGEGVTRVASYLESHDTRQLSGDLERFARRQPALFIGGAFALGFLAARLLKSSTPGDGGSEEGGL
jgi:hypothetical protein